MGQRSISALPISSGSLRLPLSLTLAAFTEREHQARGRAGCVHRHSSSWDACCNSNHRLNVTDVEGEDKLPLHPSQSPTLLASLQENLRIVLQKPTRSWFETPHAEGFVHLGRARRQDAQAAQHQGTTLVYAFHSPGHYCSREPGLGIASFEHSNYRLSASAFFQVRKL